MQFTGRTGIVQPQLSSFFKKKRRSSENKRVRQEQRIIFTAPVKYDVCSTKSKAKWLIAHKDDLVEEFVQPVDEVADQRFRSVGRRAGRSQSIQLHSLPKVQAAAVSRCGSRGIRESTTREPASTEFGQKSVREWLQNGESFFVTLRRSG